MFTVETETIGGATVVHCEGSLVRSEALNKVREAITKQNKARVVLLDLSEITRVGSGTIGLLAALQEWTRDHGIQFHLFDPPDSIRQGLEKTKLRLDVAAMPDVLTLLDWEGVEGETEGDARRIRHVSGPSPACTIFG